MASTKRSVMDGIGLIRRPLFAAAVAAVLALAATGPASAQWDETYFPNVELVDQDGTSLHLWDDLFHEKIVVVNFVYTECPDICGLSTARMARVVEWLGDKVGRDIFFYSISLDPETDTPEKLKEYAAAFDAPKGWVFLTGSRKNVDIVRHKLGERSESLSQHRSDMVIGNAATGEWRRASLMGSLVVLTEEILSLDPSWTRQPVTAPATAESQPQLVITDTLGEGLFLGACAACHSIGEGKRFGPDLAGVTLRRGRDWLEAYMLAPDRILAGGDATAMALDRDFPAVRMPNLQLNKTDVDDLIHYLSAQTELLGQSQDEDEQAAHAHAGHSHSHDHAQHGPVEEEVKHQH